MLKSRSAGVSHYPALFEKPVVLPAFTEAGVIRGLTETGRDPKQALPLICL